MILQSSDVWKTLVKSIGRRSARSFLCSQYSLFLTRSHFKTEIAFLTQGTSDQHTVCIIRFHHSAQGHMATPPVLQMPTGYCFLKTLLCLLLLLNAVSPTFGRPGLTRGQLKPVNNNQNMTSIATACTTMLKNTTAATSFLFKRAWSYDDFVQQGNRNRCLQEAFESDVEQSPFTPEDYGQLVEYGWIDSWGPSRAMVDSVLGRLETRAFAREWPQGIGMTLETPPLVAIRWIHSKESTKTHTPSGAGASFGAPRKYNVSMFQRKKACELLMILLQAHLCLVYDHPGCPKWRDSGRI